MAGSEEEQRISPARAAGVSTVLQRAGIDRSREFPLGKGKWGNYEGFIASPAPFETDKVQVEWAVDTYSEFDGRAENVYAGLARCREALEAKGYPVEEGLGRMVFPAETGWEDGVVLLVGRKD